jgi:hypothetical protein
VFAEHGARAQPGAVVAYKRTAAGLEKCIAGFCIE